MRFHSEHIFHFDPLADLSGINVEGRGFKLRRAGDNGGVTRKAEAFFGEENCHIHFAVGIFVVKQRNRVSALCDARYADIGGITGRNLGTIAFRILAAIREKFRIGRRADEDVALQAAQAIDAYIKR